MLEGRKGELKSGARCGGGGKWSKEKSLESIAQRGPQLGQRLARDILLGKGEERNEEECWKRPLLGTG